MMSFQARQYGDPVLMRHHGMPAIPGRCRSPRAVISFRVLVCLICGSSLAILSPVLISYWTEIDSGRQVEGRTFRDWVSLLGDPDTKVRNEAVEVLIKVGREAAPYLLGTLDDRNVQRRRDAALVMQKIRPKDRSSALALADALYDRDRWVRWRAAQTLRGMGPAAKDAVLPLASALEDTDPLVRLTAAQALGDIGQKAMLAHPALMRAMQDDRVFVRRAATAAMVKIMPGIEGGQGQEVDPMLKYEY